MIMSTKSEVGTVANVEAGIPCFFNKDESLVKLTKRDFGSSREARAAWCLYNVEMWVMRSKHIKAAKKHTKLELLLAQQDRLKQKAEKVQARIAAEEDKREKKLNESVGVEGVLEEELEIETEAA
jgi:hypothetical protein